jgi:hypothetical protein
MRNISGINPNVLFTTGNWRNWNNTHQRIGVRLSRPRNITELVAAVVHSERQGRPIHAHGSSWSFSDVAASEGTAIDLSQLRDLDDPVWLNTASILKPALRDSYTEDCKDTPALFLAKGGARLFEINEYLWKEGYALKTLGGSQGQSIAGAVSTATHGADNDYSSVADAVRAIHLVAAGGQEYWIERTPPNDVTDLNAWERNYFAYEEDCIEVVREDEVFYAALVSAGRFGVIFTMILEVDPRFYPEQEIRWRNWPAGGQDSVEDRLRRVARENSWNVPGISGQSPVESTAPGPDFLEILIDPKGPTHHYSLGAAFVRRRWRTRVPGDVHLRMSWSTAPGAVLSELQLAQFLSTAGLFPVIVPDFFAFKAREAFAKQVTLGAVATQVVRVDRSYVIACGLPPADYTYASMYDEFALKGPFVESMEFFFDAFDERYIQFINDVLARWGTIAAGYISVRFTRTRSPALLGMQRYDNTVAVELTVIYGLPDGQGTVNALLDLRRQYGAIAHWGQNNNMTAPEVQWRYGGSARRWRGVLHRLSEHGNLYSFSNEFSRDKGLEWGPGVMLTYDGRLRGWLGWNRDRKSTFHSGAFVGPAPAPGSLHLSRQGIPGAVIHTDGRVQAKWQHLDHATLPGNLVFRREGKTMAVVEPSGALGNLYYCEHEWLPDWLLQ